MPAIQQIRVFVNTGVHSTDGVVFLALCGREFVLDKAGNDFQSNQNQEFILGDPNNGFSVKNPGENDPKHPIALHTEDLARFPCYLRLEANGRWSLKGGSVNIVTAAGTSTLQLLPPNTQLVLGPTSGKFLYLRTA